MTHAKLTDPRERGPKPPFRPQPQSAPGIDELDPPADHGEKGYRSSRRLEGRIALVTGGDSGIGRAVALLYAQEGAHVVITSLVDDAADGEVTVAGVEKFGGKTLSVPGDIRKKAFCKELVERAVKEFGGIDILVNNAAFQRYYDKLEDIAEDEIDDCLSTNIKGTILMTQAAVPHMRPGACVINTSSIQAFMPTPQLIVYAATKAAIANLTKSLAGMLIEKGIRVNSVAPGPVWTPFVPTTMPDKKVESFGEETLFKRPAQPVEHAAIFVFLASDDASYVTGEVYTATGGRTPL